MRNMLLLCTLSLLSACLPTSFAPAAAVDDAAAAAGDPGFVSLERGAYSGMTTAGQQVVREKAAYAALLERVSIGRAPDALPPAVDFSRDMVIAVFLGTRRTGGYGIEVVRVATEGAELVVRVRHSSPAPGAMLTQALTAPYHLVRTPRSDLPVRFVVE